jgi:hypothetical protein
MSQTIAEQVIVLKERTASRAPAEIVAVFDAEQAGLDAAGIPPGIPVPGTTMPDGELLDVAGVATTLAAIRDGAPAVVVFIGEPGARIAASLYEPMRPSLYPSSPSEGSS